MHPFEIIRASGSKCKHCGGTVGPVSDMCLDCGQDSCDNSLSVMAVVVLSALAVLIIFCAGK